MTNNNLASNNPLPLVSVIIPVLNGVSHLECAIKSVIDQKYSNIELIVIDGNSIDGTVDIIKRYEDRIACWISEPDNGIYDAMNKGVRLSHGEWVYFMGADDVLLNILHQIVRSFQDRQTIYYGDVFMTSNHKIYAGKFTAKKLGNKNIPHQAMFYPKSVFDKYCYDTKYSVFADYHLNIRCFGDKTYHFEYIKVLVAIFNDCGRSSNGNDAVFFDNFVDLLKMHLREELGAIYLLRKQFRKTKKALKRKIECYMKSIVPKR